MAAATAEADWRPRSFAEQLGEDAPEFDSVFADAIRAFGRFGDCLYDRDALAAAVASMEIAPNGVASSKLLPAEDLQWSLNRRWYQPPIPESFKQRGDQVRLIKLLLSIALERIRRDGELRSEYAGLRALASSRNHTTSARDGREVTVLLEFERALGNAVFAIMAYGHTVVQLLVDLEKKQQSDGGLSVAATLDALCDVRYGKAVSPRGDKAMSRASFRWLRRRAATLRLDDNSMPYDKQVPVNGRFWNAYRPTLGCSALMRLCERPDGCRNICNLDYMLYRKLPTTAAPSNASLLAAVVEPSARPGDAAWLAVPIDMVGFGSNNEFEWEESLILAHRHAMTSSSSNGAVNPLRSIVSFDCTIKAVTPSAIVSGMPGGFGFGKLCLDKVPSDMSITMAELNALLRTNQRKAPGGTRVAELQWFGDRAAAVKDGVLGGRLALLKIDVEGYEFGSVPQWLRDDVADMKAVASSAGLRPAARALQADQLQMEFHRMGHKTNRGMNAAGSLQGHLLMLHIYALGFIPVANERNHQDNCCYEYSFVSSNFHIMSESWQVASAATGGRA